MYLPLALTILPPTVHTLAFARLLSVATSISVCSQHSLLCQATTTVQQEKVELPMAVDNLKGAAVDQNAGRSRLASSSKEQKILNTGKSLSHRKLMIIAVLDWWRGCCNAEGYMSNILGLFSAEKHERTTSHLLKYVFLLGLQFKCDDYLSKALFERVVLLLLEFPL